MTSHAVSIKFLALIGGPIASVIAALWLINIGFDNKSALTLGVTVLCVSWWIFTPIPIPATSLIPLTVLPLFGVLTVEQTSNSYGHPLILLLLGGFILSTAMERSGAHRRIALTMVRAFGGTSSRRLVLGFMVASATLSMWISNTATTLMLLPVAMAVIEKSRDQQLAIPLLLGIAYAASVGGIGTPIGTPPNVVLMGIYEETFGESINFATWMSWGLPTVIIFVPIVWLWLTRKLNYQGHIDLPEVGNWTAHERRVLAIFVLTAFAWITRREPFGGWEHLFDLSGTKDYMVAFASVICMFLIPNGKGEKLLDWDSAAKIEWGMLILFGAGLSIAAAFSSTGLSTAIGETLAAIAKWDIFFILLTLCLAVTFLTEMTSNTATTSLLMPILAVTAVAASIDPKLLMIPAAMSASCAFMLPVATAPNVVVFSTVKFCIERMIREGFALNIIGALVISTLSYFLLT